MGRNGEAEGTRAMMKNGGEVRQIITRRPKFDRKSSLDLDWFGLVLNLWLNDGIKVLWLGDIDIDVDVDIDVAIYID